MFPFFSCCPDVMDIFYSEEEGRAESIQRSKTGELNSPSSHLFDTAEECMFNLGFDEVLRDEERIRRGAEDFIETFCQSFTEENRRSDKNPQYLRIEVGVRLLPEVLDKVTRSSGGWTRRTLIGILLMAWKLFAEEMSRSVAENETLFENESFRQKLLIFSLFTMARTIAMCVGTLNEMSKVKTKEITSYSLGLLFSVRQRVCPPRCTNRYLFGPHRSIQ